MTQGRLHERTEAAGPLVYWPLEYGGLHQSVAYRVFDPPCAGVFGARGVCRAFFGAKTLNQVLVGAVERKSVGERPRWPLAIGWPAVVIAVVAWFVLSR